MLRFIFILFALFSYVPLLSGQDKEVKKIGPEQGISSSYVVSITMDRQGFLWFATESGLNRFNGHSFTIFKKQKNGPDIGANDLNKVFADPEEDIIWIATQTEGLTRLSYATGEVKRYVRNAEVKTTISSNDITDISSAGNGNLWLSTFSSGVNAFNRKNGESVHYNTQTVRGMASNRVWTAREDHRGFLYIGHVGEGLTIVSLKNKKGKTFRYDVNDPNSLPGNTVRSICIDKNDNVWIGTNNGLALYDRERQSFITFPARPIFDITQLKDGKLAIGTENGGLNILDINRPFLGTIARQPMEKIGFGDDSNGLPNATIRSIFQDAYCNIWLGTYGSGINFLSYSEAFFNQWSWSPVQTRKDVLNNPVAWGMTTDQSGRVWVGTDGGGVNIFDQGKRFRTLNRENGNLNDNAVLTSMTDSKGNVWLGTFYGGVLIFDKNIRKKDGFVVGENNNDVRCIYETRDGQVWIGTTLGLYKHIDRPGKGRLYTRDVSGDVPLDLIRTITEGPNGELWIGFFGRGIAVLDRNLRVLRRYNTRSGLPSNKINHLYKSADGRIWGASPEGLFCFSEEGKLQVWNEKDGLTNTDIRAITSDDQGNLWFSTINGIGRFVVKQQKFFHYDHHHGIAKGDFMSGSVTKDPAGRLYFGSQNGAYYFDPLSIPTAIRLAPTIITGFRTFKNTTGIQTPSRGLIPGKRITLDYDQNTFSISFHVLDYALSPLVQYSYRIKGLDEVWHDAEGTEVTFRNIPPGDYEFLVRTRIINQDWGTKVLSTAIRISPPFWLSWWAKTAYAVAIVTILWLVFRFYKRKLTIENSLTVEKMSRLKEQELHEERIRFFANITHELRTPITLILGPLEDIREDQQVPEDISNRISVIHKSATRLLGLVNQLMDFQKIEDQSRQLVVRKDNVVRLLRDISLKYKEYSLNKPVSFEMSADKDEILLYFDEEILSTIVENLLSNAFKYTHEGYVQLSVRTVITEDSSFLEIEVKDTGQGISEQELPYIFDRYYQSAGNKYVSGTGIGLSLVRALAQIHEGDILVESRRDKGSAFRLRLGLLSNYPDAHHPEQEHLLSSWEEEEPAEVDKKPVVLIVEDDYDILDYIAKALSGQYLVHTATNGRSGLEAALLHIPDVIVSDIMMPEMDGFQMSRALKNDIRTSHIPLVLLTAKDDTSAKKEGYDIGVDSYMVKPFSAGLLHSRIANLLASRNKLAGFFSQPKGADAQGGDPTPALNKLDHEFLKKVEAVIEANMKRNKVDVALIAGEMNMSHSTLYRKIKGLSDISPNEFIRKVKLRYAAGLLQDGRHSMTEVSSAIGISSVTYFRQAFKEQFGISPSEYTRNGGIR